MSTEFQGGCEDPPIIDAGTRNAPAAGARHYAAREKCYKDTVARMQEADACSSTQKKRTKKGGVASADTVISVPPSPAAAAIPVSVAGPYHYYTDPTKYTYDMFFSSARGSRFHGQLSEIRDMYVVFFEDDFFELKMATGDQVWVGMARGAGFDPKLFLRDCSYARKLCYTVKQTPLDDEGKNREICVIKRWIRDQSVVASEDDAKRVLAGLRYKKGELEQFIALAKYRALKRRYPADSVTD
ncbi:hypothetical protein TGRH88_082260 [Toxoplasma gondii]|uniref:Uncharacterized protein n=1 Tax=Toxoplasma gondii TaxID=5811 RepID=A0A7J6K7E9_TOXGO|nr:hypothetical protein TGRH88_082260 [Toxoplasma gondii]